MRNPQRIHGLDKLYSTSTISFYHVKELKWQRKGRQLTAYIDDAILFCLITVWAMCNN